MKDRLLPLAIGALAVFVVGSHLAPSVWPGAGPGEPPRARRAAPVAAAATPPPAPILAGASLRGGEADPIVTGSIRPALAAEPAPERNARVVVKAGQSVAISAEINARIVSMPFREGDRFHAGTTLVEFDCRRTRAELAAATAALNLNRNALDTARQLHKLGAAGVYDVRRTQFEAEKASADVESLKAKEATCRISAPFEGVVAERLAAAHEVVAPNQPLLRIVDVAEPELQLVVPSAWIDHMAPGRTFAIDLDETGARYRARIDGLSGAVDPVSQTVRVLARFEDRPAGVAPGMSGTARFVEAGGEP